MEKRFIDKTVIVTGASSGIGLGTARRFSAEGANVVIAARRKDRLDEIAAELGTDHTLAVRVDVTSKDDVDAMAAAALDRFDRIDVLVSNAGFGAATAFADLDYAEWQSVIDTNLTSAYLSAKACLPALVHSGGNIVHTASASGLGGDAGLTAYNAAKGAIVNFTRGLAFDLGREGVRVNAVAPSFTVVEGNENMLSDDFLAAFRARRALEGNATPDDIAAAIAFLASEDARFISGVILPVDGGVTAGSGQPRF